MITDRCIPDPANNFVADVGNYGRFGGVSFHADGTVFQQPGGEVLYQAWDPKLNVWDPRTGRRIDAVEVPPGGKWIGDVSPDRKILAYGLGIGAGAVELRLWDRLKKVDLAKATFPGSFGVHFSADGRRLFLHAKESEVWVLDPWTLQKNGQIAITGGPYARGGQVWNTTYSGDGYKRFELPMEKAPPKGRQYTLPTGTIRQWDLSAKAEGVVLRWVPESTVNVAEDYLGEVHYFRNYAVSRDGRRVAVHQYIGQKGPKGPDNRNPVEGGEYITVYNAVDGRQWARVPIFYDREAHRGTTQMTLSPDGRVALVYGCFGTAAGSKLPAGPSDGGKKHPGLKMSRSLHSARVGITC